MTGGLGFTKLSQSLQKTNRSFLSHTEKTKSKKDDLTYLKTSTRYKFIKSTKKGLESIQKDALNRKRKETIRNIAILLIVMVVLGSLLLFAFLT